MTSPVAPLFPLSELLSHERIVLYTAGGGTQSFLSFVEARHPQVLPRFVGIVDEDPGKRGKRLAGIEVRAAAELPDLNPDLVLIGSALFRSEIEGRLAAQGPWPVRVATEVEEFVLHEAKSASYMVFYPGREFAGDPSNWWGANLPCLTEMLRASGFARVDVVEQSISPGGWYGTAILHAWK